MGIKKKLNHLNKPLKIYIDKEYFEHRNLIIYLFEKVGLKQIKIINFNNSSNIQDRMNYDIQIFYDYIKSHSYDYMISSDSKIHIYDENTLYILNNDTIEHINKDNNILLISTSNPCNCYIESIVKQDKVDVLEINFNNNIYSLIIKKQNNEFYEFLLMMICLFNDLSFDVELIIKYISCYQK